MQDCGTDRRYLLCIALAGAMQQVMYMPFGGYGAQVFCEHELLPCIAAVCLSHCCLVPGLLT